MPLDRPAPAGAIGAAFGIDRTTGAEGGHGVDGAGEGGLDPATRHARALLGALDLEATVPSLRDPVSPALEWARSGAMALTGEPDGPPGFAAGPLACAARGAGLALAALAPGRGFEALDTPALLGERAALFGFARRGTISCGGSARLLPTGDGWLGLNLPREDDWRLVAAWLEAELPADLVQRRDWIAVAEALARRDAAPLVARGREIGLAVALAAPAPPTDAPPLRLEHASRSPRRAAARPPRVLDLSTLWAGPLAGSLLVAAGFEVAKVESPARPDGARAGESGFFDLLNADKQACALDLTDPRDRVRFERLLAVADVVLESARPRALAQLGFDARTWVEERPGRLWASITGYGRDHEWIAFGDDAALAAGLAFEPAAVPRDHTPGPPRALGARRPRFCADAIADPLTGLTAAVAILGLVAAGRGGLLSLSLADVAAHAARPAGDPEHFPLTGPIESRAGGAWIDGGRGLEPIAPPRARRPRGRAPALAPPTDAWLARWTAAC